MFIFFMQLKKNKVEKLLGELQKFEWALPHLSLTIITLVPMTNF